MLSTRLYKKGRYLALLLRHKPEKADLTLDSGGWAEVPEVLTALHITYAELCTIVEENNKKRFALNEEGIKIRASQGHSIKVDLGLSARIPPDILYHGTIELYLNHIFVKGLISRQRKHVHLSPDTETAIEVGKRRGPPFVLHIAAIQMHADGYIFYLSDNGVWLTEEVPAHYLAHIDRPPGE
jgi:putative RNA 2'-phosphotransferase